MSITVEVIVKSDLDTVWRSWTSPEDIMNWNAASDDWRTSLSEVDLKAGGEFLSRMEAKDGSVGFDFRGTFRKVVEKELIQYAIEDGRQVNIEFLPVEGGVKVIETFDEESTHTREQQEQGWQSILNNFARYVEAKS